MRRPLLQPPQRFLRRLVVAQVSDGRAMSVQVVSAQDPFQSLAQLTSVIKHFQRPGSSTTRPIFSLGVLHQAHQRTYHLRARLTQPAQRPGSSTTRPIFSLGVPHQAHQRTHHLRARLAQTAQRLSTSKTRPPSSFGVPHQAHQRTHHLRARLAQ
ncbi:MAG: hypothetical protein AAF970_10090, partial [Bacteroidota bacterium]